MFVYITNDTNFVSKVSNDNTWTHTQCFAHCAEALLNFSLTAIAQYSRLEMKTLQQTMRRKRYLIGPVSFLLGQSVE